MNALLRALVVSISAIAMSVSVSLAATLTLTVNQPALTPGQPLTLSASILPTGDVGVPVDLYVAAVTPDGGLLTLGSTLTWSTAVAPIARDFALTSLQAADFYSVQLPASLAGGQYTFYLIAVTAGQSPFDAQNWLGMAFAPMTFQAGPASTLSLITSNATCTVDQYCNAPLVAGVSGGSTPYHFQQDSFAYGTRPLNTNIDLGTGNLVGTPSVAGTYTFRICAVDVGGSQDCESVTVTVEPKRVTGTWTGTLNLPGAPISGCNAETISFSLSLVEDAAMRITGSTSNNRTISSGSRSGNVVTVSLNTMFGARGPYAWTWDGNNTITGSMAYFCYSLDNGALLSEGTESFTVSR